MINIYEEIVAFSKILIRSFTSFMRIFKVKFKVYQEIHFF